MKNKRNVLYSLIILLAGVIYFPVQAQQKNGAQDVVNAKGVITSHGPNSMVRNIKKDRNGNILIASFDGVFRYDGKSFTNITSKISSPRFWDVQEDRKGNLWLSTRDAGVYYYNGKSLQYFTTQQGLASNQALHLYEDKTGNIWFGTAGGGVSRYDGKSFRNYKMNVGPQAPSDNNDNDVNSIIEDKTGKFWFGTRGNTFVYNGKTFTKFTNKGKPFTNVRTIIEDKKGNIWLGGKDGLWRYDGKTFTNFTEKFVGYIYEDKKGNIWTSSVRAYGQGWALSRFDEKPFGDNSQAWALSRYDGKSLSNKKPTVTEITYKPMFFGILEANDGSIWVGALDGVYRYDGNTISDFKVKEDRK